MKKENADNWDFHIRAGCFELHLEDLWRYRDLLFMFMRRDFVVVQKQTILGPSCSSSSPC